MFIGQIMNVLIVYSTLWYEVFKILTNNIMYSILLLKDNIKISIPYKFSAKNAH